MNDYDKSRTLKPPEPLKACPFCDGKALLLKCCGAYGLPAIRVRCTKCQASPFVVLYECGRLTESGGTTMHFEDATNEAVERWNRRAAQ